MIEPAVTARRQRVALALLVAALALLTAAGRSAWEAFGTPFPSFVTDPFLTYSALSLPSWQLPEGIVRPDRIVAVEGRALPTLTTAAPGRAALHAALGCVEGPSVRLTLSGPGGTRTRAVPLRRHGAAEVIVFFGLYASIGLVMLWSGLSAYVLAERRAGARAYTTMSLGGFAFCALFFDYHTTARLWPLFSLSTVWLVSGMFWVAWAFPAPPPPPVAAWRFLVRVLWALMGCLGLWVSVGPMLGIDAFHGRLLVDGLVILALLALCVSVLTRYRRAAPDDRVELRPVLGGLVLAPAVAASGFLASQVSAFTVVHLLLPLVVFVVPLSIGWALVRHNILAARAVVTRRWLYVPTAAVGAVVALLGWLAFRNVGPPSMDALSPVMASGGLFAAVLVLLRRLTGWALFPAEAEFRPTVEQLADSLARTRDEAELLDAIARNVTSWLPSGRIRLVAPQQVDEIDHLPDGARSALEVGRRVWTTEGPWERQLLVPMRSLGVLQRVLVIAPKRDRALFTESDLSLLDTVAALGAQSLHNATMLRDLEDARRLERDASRGDKRATLGILGAELAHEIAHPLQLFRGLLRKASRGPLSADDIDVGGDELARLERLLANMRRLEAPPPRRESVALGPVVARAALLGRELREDRRQQLALDLPDDLTVLGDADAMVQIFANLLRNAAEAAPVRGAVGVTARREGGHAVVDVWDDGPGVPDDRVDSLFQRWVTTKDGGSGLGLAVASSLALSLGWRIVYVREDARTCFRLTAPADAAALSAPPSHPSE